MKIANTINKELLSSGYQQLSQEDFNSLVEAEYVKVKHQLPCRSKDQDLLTKSILNTFSVPTQNTSTRNQTQAEPSATHLFSAYSSREEPIHQFSIPPPNMSYPQFTRPAQNVANFHFPGQNPCNPVPTPNSAVVPNFPDHNPI